jgi:actin-like ATPase involved in cell morphogenesis
MAQLHGLAEQFAQEFGVRVQVAPDPALAAVMGAGRILEQALPASIREAMKEEESMRVNYST